MDFSFLGVVLTLVGGLIGWIIRYFQDRKRNLEAAKEHEVLVKLRNEHNESIKSLNNKQERIADLQEELALTHSKLEQAVEVISQLQIDEVNSFAWAIHHRGGNEYLLINDSRRTDFNVQLRTDSPMFRDTFKEDKLQSGNALLFNYLAVMGGGDYLVYFSWQDKTGREYWSDQVRFNNDRVTRLRFRGVPNDTESDD